jgi:hypothetical protein
MEARNVCSHARQWIKNGGGSSPRALPYYCFEIRIDRDVSLRFSTNVAPHFF